MGVPSTSCKLVGELRQRKHVQGQVHSKMYSAVETQGLIIIFFILDTYQQSCCIHFLSVLMPIPCSQISPACGLTGNHINCVTTGPDLPYPLQSTAFPFLWDSAWVSSSRPARRSGTSTSWSFTPAAGQGVLPVMGPLYPVTAAGPSEGIERSAQGFTLPTLPPGCCPTLSGCPTHSGCIELQDNKVSWHWCPSSLLCCALSPGLRSRPA